jgi:hypothetical protein
MERESAAAAWERRRDQPIDAEDIEVLTEFCEKTDALCKVTDELSMRVARHPGLPAILTADELTELRKVTEDALVDLRAMTSHLEELRAAIE